MSKPRGDHHGDRSGKLTKLVRWHHGDAEIHHPCRAYYDQHRSDILEGYDPGDEINEDDYARLFDLFKREEEESPKPLGRNRELWRIWVLVHDCRERDGMGGAYGMKWPSVDNVLDRWHGIALNAELHGDIGRVCNMVRRVEAQTRRAKQEQD